MQKSFKAKTNPSEFGHELGIALTTKHPNETIEQRLQGILSSFNKSDSILALQVGAFPHFHVMLLHLLNNKIVGMAEDEGEGEGEGEPSLPHRAERLPVESDHEFSDMDSDDDE